MTFLSHSTFYFLFLSHTFQTHPRFAFFLCFITFVFLFIFSFSFTLSFSYWPCFSCSFYFELSFAFPFSNLFFSLIVSLFDLYFYSLFYISIKNASVTFLFLFFCYHPPKPSTHQKFSLQHFTSHNNTVVLMIQNINKFSHLIIFLFFSSLTYFFLFFERFLNLFWSLVVFNAVFISNNQTVPEFCTNMAFPIMHLLVSAYR